MIGRRQQNSESHVKDLWRRWTAVVESCARRAKWKKSLSSAEYSKLHAALVAACRELEAHSQDEAQRERCRAMVELAEPWITLESLKQTHRELLVDLLRRGQRAAGPWGRSHRWYLSRQRLIGLAMILLAAGAVFVLTIYVGSEAEATSASNFADRAYGQLMQLSFRVRWSSFVERFYVITIAVVIVAIYVGTRTVKRWS